MNPHVHLLGNDDLYWPLGSDSSDPAYKVGYGSYPRSIKVSPYPCYHHDVGLVESLFEECFQAFALPGSKICCCILSHDFASPTNGLTCEDSIYRREDGSDWDDKIGDRTFSGQALTIVLAGKRIPIHPAVTRYLVAHEYGHCVTHWIARKLGHGDYDKLVTEYAKLRGLETKQRDYSGGKWHLDPGEIMANDWRLLFTGRETEFWPHEVGRPTVGLKEWWDSHR